MPIHAAGAGGAGMKNMMGTGGMGHPHAPPRSQPKAKAKGATQEAPPHLMDNANGGKGAGKYGGQGALAVGNNNNDGENSKQVGFSTRGDMGEGRSYLNRSDTPHAQVDAGTYNPPERQNIPGNIDARLGENDPNSHAYHA